MRNLSCPGGCFSTVMVSLGMHRFLLALLFCAGSARNCRHSPHHLSSARLVRIPPPPSLPLRLRGGGGSDGGGDDEHVHSSLKLVGGVDPWDQGGRGSSSVSLFSLSNGVKVNLKVASYSPGQAFLRLVLHGGLAACPPPSILPLATSAWILSASEYEGQDIYVTQLCDAEAVEIEIECSSTTAGIGQALAHMSHLLSNTTITDEALGVAKQTFRDAERRLSRVLEHATVNKCAGMLLSPKDGGHSRFVAQIPDDVISDVTKEDCAACLDRLIDPEMVELVIVADLPSSAIGEESFSSRGGLSSQITQHLGQVKASAARNGMGHQDDNVRVARGGGWSIDGAWGGGGKGCNVVVQGGEEGGARAYVCMAGVTVNRRCEGPGGAGEGADDGLSIMDSWPVTKGRLANGRHFAARCMMLASDLAGRWLEARLTAEGIRPRGGVSVTWKPFDVYRGGLLSVCLEPEERALADTVPAVMRLLEELFENGFPLTGSFHSNGLWSIDREKQIGKEKRMEKVDEGEKGGFEGAGGDVDKVQEGVDEIGFQAVKMSYVSACKHALRTSSAWLSLMTHLQGPLVRKEVSSVRDVDQGYATISGEDVNHVMKAFWTDITSRMAVCVGVSPGSGLITS